MSQKSSDSNATERRRNGLPSSNRMQYVLVWRLDKNNSCRCCGGDKEYKRKGDNVARKPKSPQKENLTEADGRDLFQTPNYAVDILIPFLDKLGIKNVWECAAGLGKITQRLSRSGYSVIATDISYSKDGGHFNFLTDHMTWLKDHVIVTNTPFSLKKKFFKRALEYNCPFAFLIPADYSGWIIEACQNGAEKIVPTRRIDYITPNTLQRIHEGELWEDKMQEYHEKYGTLKEFAYHNMSLWYAIEERNSDYCLYKDIYSAPPKLLRKYSSSYFHSMWLTWGFNIGKQETFVELTNEMKDNI